MTPGKPLRSLSDGEESLELRRHYLQNLVHELSTPLTPLLGYLKLFERQSLGELNELQQRCFERMNRSATRLRRILEDFSLLLQIESGMYEPEPIPVDLAEVAQTALGKYESDAKDRSIEILVEPSREPEIWVTGDEEKLVAAVGHLLSNGLKFNSGGGKLLVRWGVIAEQPLATARLEVFDTGIGIEHEDLERVFDPFFQSDHSETRRFGGAGLGLSIIKWIAKVHDGSISLESPPQEQPPGHFFRGVRAVLDLPLRPGNR